MESGSFMHASRQLHSRTCSRNLFSQNFLRDFHIVKRDLPSTGDLHFFVTLAGDEHDISRARLADSQSNGRLPVGLGLVLCAGTL